MEKQAVASQKLQESSQLEVARLHSENGVLTQLVTERDSQLGILERSRYGTAVVLLMRKTNEADNSPQNETAVFAHGLFT